MELLTLAAYAAAGFTAGAVLSIIISVAMRFVVRRRTGLGFVSRRLKVPQRLFLTLLGAGIGVGLATATTPTHAAPEWRPVFMQGFLIVMILAGAYLATGAMKAVEDAIVARARADEGTPHFRRVRTQMQVITQVLIAVLWICAVAWALFTFPQFRAIGASLFASAGLLSIVAGLAAQSSLSNVFAGMQIAFSDALRVGDLVVFDTQMGTVEEITLTYVVVRTWDDRRWIVPSTAFTTKAFENWTRGEAQMLGTVELDLDWLVPVEAMRVELTRIVQASALWDGRSVNLQVTDAVGGPVRIRAVVSASSSGELWDLRCHVREELIGWVQRHAVYALPRTRLEPETTTAPSIEEREEYVEQVLTEWEQEKALEESAKETVVMPPITQDSPKPMPRSWFQALRDQRGVD
ncbi:mechanosensitive ion channel family protein [Tessaracoccus sp. Z1128]